MPNVHFVNWNRTVRVGPLSNLRRTALLAGLPLYNGLAKILNCRGMGSCGTCRVRAEPAEALTPPTFFERIRGCRGPMRLACQTRVASDKQDVTVTKMSGFSGKGRVPVPGPGAPPSR